MDAVFQRIVSAVDFDSNSIAALDFAARLARQNRARIFLVHVIPTVPEAESVPAYADVYLSEENRLGELKELGAKHLHGASHEVIVKTGDPAVGILHAADEVSADLIVLSAYRSTGRPHGFMGSVAARVAGEARCAVLTAHPGWHGDVDSVGARMTRNPATIDPDATLAQAYQAMTVGGFRMMPVVKKNKLLGVVTDRDVRRRSQELEETLVGAAMTEEVVYVAPDTSIRQAALTMLECEIGGMPVVENGRLVGVITTTDVLKAMIR